MLQLITASRAKVQINYRADIWRRRYIHSEHRSPFWCLVPFRGQSWKHGQNVLSKRVPHKKDEDHQSTPGGILDDWARGRVMGWELKRKTRLETFIPKSSSYLLLNNGFLWDLWGPRTLNPGKHLHSSSSVKTLSHGGEISPLSPYLHLKLRKPYVYDMNVKFICLFVSREGWAGGLSVDAALF